MNVVQLGKRNCLLTVQSMSARKSGYNGSFGHKIDRFDLKLSARSQVQEMSTWLKISYQRADSLGIRCSANNEFCVAQLHRSLRRFIF